MITSSGISSQLFGRARESVIGILFGQPGARYHLREIARQAGLSAPTIKRELDNLLAAHVVVAERVGNQIQFMASDRHPLAPELRSIAVKTWGVIGRVREALSGRKDIKAAFVFGSYASGTAKATSDVDIVVLSEAPVAGYFVIATELSDELRRVVSIKVYRPVEWTRKHREAHPFVGAVMREPKLFIVGSEEVFDVRRKSAQLKRAPKGRKDL